MTERVSELGFRRKGVALVDGLTGLCDLLDELIELHAERRQVAINENL